MMKNRKLLSLFGGLFIVGVTALTSCGGGDVAGAATIKWRDKEESLSFRRVRAARGYNDTKSSNRTLIIPVDFTDFPRENVYGNQREEDGARIDLYKVNFGTAEENQWESLASYYKKSSYGVADFQGAVAPWYTPKEQVTGEPYSAVDFGHAYSSAGAQQVLYAAYEFLWRSGYKQNFVIGYEAKGDGTHTPIYKTFATGAECIKYFDRDEDGLIDNCQIIYSAPYHLKDSEGQAVNDELFWAFRSITGDQPRASMPKPFNYLWMSNEFFYDNGYWEGGTYKEYTTAQKIANDDGHGKAIMDSHTLIHETGHALGAEDYYTNQSGDKEAAAQFVMMAYNVGDHDPWTKLLYGWTNPTVVYKPTTLTLSAFQNDGDSTALIPLRGKWSEAGSKHTVADEYLMLEYYTPTGLQEFDCEHNYKGNYPKGPTTPGLRIWHIDARLGEFDYSSGSVKFVKYTEELLSIDSGFTYFANTNDGGDAKEQGIPVKNKLISVINVKTSNSRGAFEMNTSGKGLSTENLLTKAGDTLKSSGWKFNSGKAFGYNIKLVSINANEVVVQIG